MNDRHLSGHPYPAGTADGGGDPASGYSADYSAYTQPSYGHAYADQPGSPTGYEGADPFGRQQGQGGSDLSGAPYGGDPLGVDPLLGGGPVDGNGFADPFGHGTPGGNAPQQHSGYGHDPYGQAAAYGNGHYGTATWDSTPAHGTPAVDPAYGGHAAGAPYEAVGYGEQQWDQGVATATATLQPPAEQATITATDATGWDTADWDSWNARTDGIPAQADGGRYEDPAGGASHEGWTAGHGGYAAADHAEDGGWGHEAPPRDQFDPARDGYDDTAYGDTAYGTEADHGHEAAHGYDDGTPAGGDGSGDAAPAPLDDPYTAVLAATAAARQGGGDVEGPHPGNRRARRRPKPKRSALLTVAAPSLCVLGVSAVAASAITTPDGPAHSEDDLPLAAAGGDEVDEAAIAAAEAAAAERTAAANERLDTQLEGLTAAADDYADRASRTQGRMDLEKKKAEEQAEAEAEAARQEELRPKFFVPVDQRGMSAVYGQSGINWMSMHTGIDFPVSYGTPIRAATDGTVRTLVNPSYGNLAIVTAPDGTETWYAHLSSHVHYSGSVQAGTVIAYSGNSGKSTGPHLHFEVRPAGGAAVDPAAWLRSKGLSPN
ncbi:M23 family metallopeptidase [Streptomyces bohaiensis]|uniref:M23 family metallopeptidase n=1 Tax=Streptomyces bohaiensis TaxID=1431344 RepID=UPI0028AC055D|nr:peptidoglycan DD-metalloendopeptidase family protein [Streptomyces bohaiensis]